MASASVQSTQSRSSTADPPEARGPRYVARRRTLVLLLLLALVGLAAAANYGPLKHYLDARARLEKATADVAALETSNTELQARLSKLLEPGYLEELARQELTYSLPDEDLYIVTGGSEAPAMHSDAGSLGVGGFVPATDSLETGTISGGSTGSETTGSTAGGSQGEQPGFLERLLSRIGGLF